MRLVRLWKKILGAVVARLISKDQTKQELEIIILPLNKWMRMKSVGGVLIF
jgi:hypothetical protein